MLCLASIRDESGSWVESELRRDKESTAVIWRRRQDDDLDGGRGGGQGELGTDRSYVFSAKPTVSTLN